MIQVRADWASHNKTDKNISQRLYYDHAHSLTLYWKDITTWNWIRKYLGLYLLISGNTRIINPESSQI